MGLCFSQTTTKFGKSKYPYKEVTPLSILLWSHFFPDTQQVQVILYLVHTEPSKTQGV
jgi:hypothetical protein